MMKHTIQMLIGCILPLLLIFILPLFGVSSGVSLFIFIILVFGCHLMMMGGHGAHGKPGDNKEAEHGKH